MLERTFIHLPGIGHHKERQLWERGIVTWDLLEREIFGQRTLFPNEGQSDLAAALEETQKAWAKRDFEYFAKKLDRREHYRIALSAPQRTLFLDIETTGLSWYYDDITLIGGSVSDAYHVHFQGQPLNEIAALINDAACIVTFNGAIFDLRFLREKYSAIRIPEAHVDLRFFDLWTYLNDAHKAPIYSSLHGVARKANSAEAKVTWLLGFGAAGLVAAVIAVGALVYNGYQIVLESRGELTEMKQAISDLQSKTDAQ